MSFKVMRIKLLLIYFCWVITALGNSADGQPSCFISGGSDTICYGNLTIWSAPDGMATYYWTGPSGFTSPAREITISITGDYTVTISDLNGTNSCSRKLTVNPELSPGSINTTLRQFCAGGTAAIGGTSSPYGPATGGSGSYIYTWQFQEGCTGNWNDIAGTNTTSYTPVAPAVTTCYRRKVTDIVCNTETCTDFKRFEIFEDPVSQNIVPSPANQTICAGTSISATFTGGSGGFPGGCTDVYEYSTNNGTSWITYSPGQNIPTTGLSGSNVVQIRTRRISTGVNGCNYGVYVTISWSINPSPVTPSIFHR
jgi:hypothetical protein